MIPPEVIPWLFTGLSFIMYSMFRYFDAWSTAAVAEVLKIEQHEVNPLIVFLTKKVGLTLALRFHWLLAIPIAFIDGFIFGPRTGLPLLALLMGFIHLLAAINNFSIYFRIKEFGAESVKRTMMYTLKNMKNMNMINKIIYLTKINLSNVLLSVWNIIILVVINTYLGSIKFIVTSEFLPVTYLIYAILMNITLLIFYPLVTIGNFLLMFRNLKNIQITEFEKDDNYIVVSTELLNEAINQAKKDDATYVRFKIPE